MNQIKLGVIGGGRVGVSHIRGIKHSSNYAKLAAIIETNNFLFIASFFVKPYLSPFKYALIWEYIRKLHLSYKYIYLNRKTTKFY